MLRVIVSFGRERPRVPALPHAGRGRGRRARQAHRPPDAVLARRHERHRARHRARARLRRAARASRARSPSASCWCSSPTSRPSTSRSSRSATRSATSTSSSCSSTRRSSCSTPTKEVKEAPGRDRHRPLARARSTFEDVDFAYKGATDTLHDVSFTVEPGQRVAIVGPTGAGKTTLMSLLVRFYDPQRRADRDRRHRHPRAQARLAARADQRRPPGAAAVQRDDRRQHPLRAARRDDGRDRRGREGGERPRLHRAPARGLRHGARRARRAALGRRAPAHLGRARVHQGRADPRPRRADVVDRLQDRGRDPRRARGPHGGPDVVHDRPPPVDGPRRRPHPRPRGRPASSSRARTRSCSSSTGLYHQLHEAQTQPAPPPRRAPGRRGRRERARRRARVRAGRPRATSPATERRPTARRARRRSPRATSTRWPRADGDGGGRARAAPRWPEVDEIAGAQPAPAPRPRARRPPPARRSALAPSRVVAAAGVARAAGGVRRRRRRRQRRRPGSTARRAALAAGRRPPTLDEAAAEVERDDYARRAGEGARARRPTRQLRVRAQDRPPPRRARDGALEARRPRRRRAAARPRRRRTPRQRAGRARPATRLRQGAMSRPKDRGARDDDQDARGGGGLADAALPARLRAARLRGATTSRLHAPHAVDADAQRRRRRRRAAPPRFIDRPLRPLRPRRPLGVRRAARRRPLLRHERARAAPPLRLGAELIVNLHGGTSRCPELAATRPARVPRDRPGAAPGSSCTSTRRDTLDFLEPHCAFFTFAENHGGPDCGLPCPRASRFHPTRQPVVTRPLARRPAAGGRRVHDGRQLAPALARRAASTARRYTWSKHHEFVKFLDLPRRTGRRVRARAERATTDADRRCSRSTAGRSGDGLAISVDPDGYRDYIARLARRVHGGQGPERPAAHRAGSATAAPPTSPPGGRWSPRTPASARAPDRRGAVRVRRRSTRPSAAVEADQRRLPRATARAAAEIAREYFDADVVLGACSTTSGPTSRAAGAGAPRRLDAVPAGPRHSPPSRGAHAADRETRASAVGARVPRSRRPRRPLPGERRHRHPRQPAVHAAVRSRACSPAPTTPGHEVIVVDNGSTRRHARDYLARARARARPHVRLLLNARQRAASPAAATRAWRARAATCSCCSTTTRSSPPGWLARLLAHLEDPAVGLVGAVDQPHRQRGRDPRAVRDLAASCSRFADERAAALRGPGVRHRRRRRCSASPCAATSSSASAPLDERFEVGTARGRRLLAARRGEAGLPPASARRTSSSTTSARRRSASWCRPASYARVLDGEQAALRGEVGRAVAAVRPAPRPGLRAAARTRPEAVAATLPAGATVLVVSRGDEALLDASTAAPPGTSRRPTTVAGPGTTPATARRRSRTLEAMRAARRASSSCSRARACGGSSTTRGLPAPPRAALPAGRAPSTTPA